MRTPPKSEGFDMRPRVLDTDPHYKKLSPAAKELYTKLYSRACLSATKDDLFRDEHGVFVIYTVEEARDQLNCGKDKAINAFKELEKAGLIDRKRFNADEVRLLMEKLPEDKVGWSIRLMLATGMRTQELLGLEPRHIAKDGSTITIEQAVVRVKGSIAIGTPKSYDSYRTIPVPEMVQYCARLLRDTDKKFVWEVGKPNMPCNPSYFAHQFKAAVESVEGVRVLTPHCCRHTFVSMMQLLGVDLETIQNIAGHAEIDMTRHYLHVQEPRRLDAAQRFSDAFSKKGRGVHGNILDYKKSS